MASQQGRSGSSPSPQQRPSQQSSTPVPTFTRNDTGPSTTSVDSETVLLNDLRSHQDRSQLENAPQASPQAPQESRPPPPLSRLASSPEPRKCWICFADESEDTPTSSVWKTPCSCALTAHEACLLDWVADLEAPGPSRTGRQTRRRIECPQCKTEIIIARPHSTLVSGVAATERVLGKLTLPGLLATAASTLAAGAWVHGLISVYLVFGPADFARLMRIGDERGTSLRWTFGTALVPVALVASRITLADGLLPMVPLVLFASRYPRQAGQRGSALLWPPSAAMTFASLPYLRAAYNALWRAAFADKEARWVREVLPQTEEGAQNADGDEAGGEEGQRPADDDGGGLVQVEFELEIGRAMRVRPEVPGAAGAGGGGVVGAAEEEEAGNGGGDGPAAAVPAADADADDAAQNPAQGENNALPARANRIVNTSGRIADLIMGALCFPAVAAATGEVLKRALPPAWTADAATAVSLRRPGLLQTPWGRSVVGGCLFVVLKDTLLLYSRYRLAQNHRKRHVVDFDRRRTG